MRWDGDHDARVSTHPTAIALGSTSRHKVAALRDALDRAGMDGVAVTAYDAASGVAAQPLGEEVDVGAENRAREALDRAPVSIEYAVGVESGLSYRRWGHVDFAVAVVMRRRLHRVVGFATSVGIPIPLEAVEASIRSRRQRTAGQCLADRIQGVNPTDPHTTLTNGRLSRQQLLTDAIYAALIQVF